jgi:hypothetical protein
MKTTLTLIELADKINAHIESGGVVIDTYRERGADIVDNALYVEDEYGRRLRITHKGLLDTGTTIPSSDILEAEGHEVSYTPNSYFGYLGRIAFLNPAPVDLPRVADVAAAAAYAAAVSRCSRAVDARDAAADVAAEADADAKAARAAHEAADAAAADAYAVMVAARAAFHATTV